MGFGWGLRGRGGVGWWWWWWSRIEGGLRMGFEEEGRGGVVVVVVE